LYKRFLTAFFTAILLLLFVSFAGAKEEKICVIKSKDIAPYNSAVEGFKSWLKEKKREVQIIEYTMREDKRGNSIILKKVTEDNPDLILTICSGATELAQSYLENIPIVFSLVLNPVTSGLVKKMRSSGNNTTGASLDIPIRTQLEKLKQILPQTRRVGVIYSAETSDLISEAEKEAKSLGLELVIYFISSEDQVPKALEKLSKKIDCLWSVADGKVFTPQSTQFIILYALRNGVPFMGLSESFVKAGALFSLRCDYEDIGRQSGELALEILSGKSSSQLPISVPRKTSLVLNLRTAEQIGIEFPPTLVSLAAEVYH
jgi:putative ABC transport system substrate-binding protein